MKTTVLISLILSLTIAISTNLSAAMDVDCDELVSTCQNQNPYSEILNITEHIAYDLACSDAGIICMEMQE